MAFWLRGSHLLRISSQITEKFVVIYKNPASPPSSFSLLRAGYPYERDRAASVAAMETGSQFRYITLVPGHC